MFDPVRLSHDAIISRACRARDATPPNAAANAFIASLSTRQLQLRSALGSYATARHLRPHAFQGEMFCNICGVISGSEREIDFNVLNFERYKWGGVRHEDPIYMLFDLEQFASIAEPSPSSADVHLFRRILSVIGQLTEQERAKDLEGKLRGVIPSNKAERAQLIDTFEDALRAGRLLPSAQANAWDIWILLRRLYDRNSLDYLFLENRLRVALQDLGQSVLNTYVRGDEQPQSKSDFEQGADSFRLASELDGTDEDVRIGDNALHERPRDS